MSKKTFAKYPPMGWNSWDCYGAAVTEEILLKNAAYMAEHLKPFGWEYIVCDVQWSEPTADGTCYHPFADLCMDEYGRLLPAENRFPSAAGGRGFAAISERIHEMGLKLGIHIMRGIPRQAVAADTPVKGTEYTARQIAHTSSICCWNTDMYGIDVTRPGAQEYYDSLFELYASWGVDFVKVDDICAKYGRLNDESSLTYGGDEIELIARAIRRCGRPIVLSLSPGPAQTENAEHLAEHAAMWRITNDLWDEWPAVADMFRRCRTWLPYRRIGGYPDCDMLPLGHLSIRGCEHGVTERRTRLTREEQRTMMTLWCIFGSPLMLGCELTDMDEWTRSLVTDEELLGILRFGEDRREAFHSDAWAVWTCRRGDRHYAAIFNLGNREERFSLQVEGFGRILETVPSHGVRLLSKDEFECI